MGPLELAYSDKQLSDVINYVGENWHGWRKSHVKAEDVSEVRAAEAGRTTPWTEAELRKIAE